MKKMIYVFYIALFSFSFSLCAQTLEDAQEAYLSGDYDESARIATLLVQNGVDGNALYLLALNFFKLGKYPQARDYFRKFLRTNKDSVFVDAATVKLIDTYFLEGELPKAKALYESTLEKYPNSSYRPLIYLRLAQIAAKQGQWERKHEYIDILNKDYKNSIECVFAQRLIERGDFFTVQAGAFSKKANALSLAAKLKSQHPAYVVEERNEDLTLYKVRVGKFKNRREAEQTFDALTREGYPARIYP